MDRTQTRQEHRAPDACAWLFVVDVAEAEAPVVAHFALDGAAPVTLGRGAPGWSLERETLALRVPDPWLSSAHLRVEHAVGSWIAEDLGSKNGTTLRGARLGRAVLHDGAALVAGNTLLVFRDALAPSPDVARRAFVEPTDPFASANPSWAASLSRLRAVAPSRVPVVLEGELSAARVALASVHAASGATTPCAVLSAGADASLVRETLAGARGASVRVEDLASLDARALRALCEALAAEDAPRALVASSRPVDALVAEGALTAAMAGALAGVREAVVPVEARREDLGLWRAAAGAGAWRLDALVALYDRAWAGGWREVERVLAAGRLAAGGRLVTAADLPPAAPATLRPAPTPDETSLAFTLEGEVWAVAWGGRVHRLKDSDGMRYLAWLTSRPGEDVHARDLRLLARGEAAGELPPASDAGPMMDAAAKAAYQARVESLRDTLEEAEGWGDLERAERAREELDALTRELARAVGLGGRVRAAASDGERARVTVTLRIRKAIERIRAVDASLGEHLSESVHTGSACAYRPRALTGPRR